MDWYSIIENCHDTLKSIKYFTKIYAHTKNITDPYHSYYTFQCMWKEKFKIIIWRQDMQFYEYFRDYFDIVNMLELNEIQIIDFIRLCGCFNYCECEHGFGCINEDEHIFEECPRMCRDQIICERICDCKNHPYFNINNKLLYYCGKYYQCTYNNIREELKDVIGEILSKNKVILNEYTN